MELSVHALAIPVPSKRNGAEVTRRSANYHPSIWRDRFLAYASDDHVSEVEANSNKEQQIQLLKEKVRALLVATADDHHPSQKLDLIDAVQRLGVSYHFESEIKAALQYMYENIETSNHHKDCSAADLYTVALSFRLLRQQGHPVPCVEANYNKEQQIQLLKEKVRALLVATADDHHPSQKLDLIDAIQRLGVSYHFESEIEAALQYMYENIETSNHHKDCSLYTVALSFRLLRQQGHPVPCDVFNKFKDDKGKFQESLISDVRGMLSFYEATHLRVRGEDILDEALAFTTTHLESAIPNLSNPLAAQVIHALNQPIHKGLTRLEARQYISFYKQDDSHNKVLLNFAKQDFNMLQKLHQKELSEITRWWKGLDFAKKLPFARDRVVECYFWILGVYFEPQYFLARSILTKVIALTSVIDDIYDVYGTLDELVLFTNAIERWECSALDQLPEYMKLCYQALMDVYGAIDEEMAKEGRSYRVHYAKSAMKNLVRAYFEEAKWYHEGYVPTFEEYMGVALVTGAYRMLATTSFVGMGELVTKEAFDWVSNNPLIVQASSVISRLVDDMVGHKFEQKRGHVASAVECYMAQHGASEEEAVDEFEEQVTNAWKDVNAECLCPTAVPMPLLVRIVNLARVINVIYKDEDGYTHSGTKLKRFVTSVLVDSVPI